MKYLIISLTALMCSCGGDAQENTREQNETSSENQEEVASKGSCLAEMTDPAKWYSSAAVASLVNEPEENIKEKVNEQFHSCQYNWRNDRKHMMKAGKVEMEVPTNNTLSITIRNLDTEIEKATKMHNGKTFTYMEYFKAYYSQPTEEDQKIIDETIEKKAEEDPDAKLAKKLLATTSTENYTEIDDLGDKANHYVQVAPGLRETRLAVLDGNVAILITADVSDEDATDLTVVKTVAKAVIALCN